ncbi:hypothetical protein [Bacteroides acidifaciens]|jgi:hypothetical protein|uniref:DUF551 domain-containing protein n=2 Tax=Bacteroides acidifaciens TaxID=85831 RepID=A0A7J0A434_9BACE|nr:hypothetical protein [Bacteroides acidifaciens]GFH87124.1 hypothetical protein IMSAGC001_02548 [Bacteroides acidifaciens]
MTKIKLNWAYAKGELDTDTLKLICLPARGKRLFGADELDAELCIKDGMNYQIAEIHLGDVESSNILCEEIARRWNEFEDWHECKEETDDVPELNTHCMLRIEYTADGEPETKVDYITAVWSKYGWTKDFLGYYETADSYVITHWKPIVKPKGVKV